MWRNSKIIHIPGDMIRSFSNHRDLKISNQMTGEKTGDKLRVKINMEEILLPVYKIKTYGLKDTAWQSATALFGSYPITVQEHSHKGGPQI
jgi:hypothetical protein